MKWVFRLGLVMIFVAAFFAGRTSVSHYSDDEELNAMEAECEESGGVLARARSGYVCVVPAHQAI